MKIKVTQDHINNGIPGRPHKCPVALALRDKGIYSVGLGWSSGYVFTLNGHGYAVAPEPVQDFASCFDSSPRREDSKPFEFEFDETILNNI